ncbi:MAG TPA: large conductance mechanosensitive channel protein MscL [Flavisolibacter sp.]|jgi:large conductance mechanosensitive channel
MGFIKEFKLFALKGNVIDLAIAVIIGAAFSAIVSSLVEDVITPLLLTPALEAAGAEDLQQLAWRGVKYGKFLAAVIKFLLVALVLFTVIQGVNKLRRTRESEVQTAPAPPELTLSEKLLTEIRDGLKK